MRVNMPFIFCSPNILYSSSSTIGFYMCTFYNFICVFFMFLYVHFLCFYIFVFFCFYMCILCIMLQLPFGCNGLPLRVQYEDTNINIITLVNQINNLRKNITRNFINGKSKHLYKNDKSL